MPRKRKPKIKSKEVTEKKKERKERGGERGK